jgi:hypothetical protein
MEKFLNYVISSKILINLDVLLNYYYFIEGGEVTDKLSMLRMMRSNTKHKKTNFIDRLHKKYGTTDANKIWYKILEHGHCSSIVKVLKDDIGNYKDILVSHSTWDGYSEMLRFFKKYYNYSVLVVMNLNS